MLRLLGQGERSRTWLALDPQRDQEVVLKLPVLEPDTDAALITRWVQQARRVSHLRHPHIVQVLEAEVHERQPYRVSVYTPGQTLLSDLLAQHAARTPTQAVVLALDILDGLACAHAAGLLHRNLKPSNVLVNAAGRAQVLDFGSTLQAGGASAYLSPEAAQGQPATPQVDVFAVGLVLAEMLTGQPLVDTRDAARAQYRLSHEQLVLPPGAEVDGGLRAIVANALAYAPAQRYADVAVLQAALVAWSPTARGAAAPMDTVPSAPAVADPLDGLLERMHRQGEFPAMTGVVARIKSLANAETDSLDSVAHEIMKDVALTNKLLRLVNSAHFGARDGHINTVSRAVHLVGFNGIRNLTLSLVLLEQMKDTAHANLLKDEFLRCLMAGTMAVALCTVGRESEEAFIGAMFQNLGRILAEYYFPGEARTVRGLLASARQPVAEATASASVLGVGFEALGLAVAQNWGLPEGIQRCMRKPRGEPPIVPPVLADERLRWTSMAANEMADILLRAPPGGLVAQLDHVQRYYARVLGLSPEATRKATVQARHKLIAMAASMEVQVLPGSGAAQLLQAPEDDAKAPPDTARPPPPPAPSRLLADALSAGILQLRQAMQGDYKPGDVLRLALATLLEALQCQRVVFCMRDPKTESLTGRFGLGEGAESAAKVFNIPLKTSNPDLFTTVCLKGADTLIHDATEPRMAARLPIWFRDHLRAPRFLLLPLHLNGKPIGLIYADSADKQRLLLDEQELALLRSLRDQALLAFKQQP